LTNFSLIDDSLEPLQSSKSWDKPSYSSNSIGWRSVYSSNDYNLRK
jgi:hypothetical protein